MNARKEAISQRQQGPSGIAESGPTKPGHFQQRHPEQASENVTARTLTVHAVRLISRGGMRLAAYFGTRCK
jgi:hypothetical protein